MSDSELVLSGEGRFYGPDGQEVAAEEFAAELRALGLRVDTVETEAEWPEEIPS